VAGSPSQPASPSSAVVAVLPQDGWRPVVQAAAGLAEALGCAWTALCVETPEAISLSDAHERSAAGLSAAAKLGGIVSRVSAETVAKGAGAYAIQSGATHLVVQTSPSRRSRETLERLLDDGLALTIVAVPADYPLPRRYFLRRVGGEPAGARDYALSALSVLLLLPLVLLLKTLIGPQALALLFLVPVLGAAALLGFLPAHTAVLLPVLCYDFFIRGPAYSLDLDAPQNLLMAGVLAGLAAFVSLLTRRLRDRALLSDRSALENARLATFGLELANAEDWPATAQAICRNTAQMLGVRTALFREVEGKLVSADPSDTETRLTPVDHAALELAWNDAEESGSGTDRLSAADWQFHPLKTSLGLLAVLAVAAEDGRDPVRPDRKMLLSTMVTQSALALERLRLQDLHSAP